MRTTWKTIIIDDEELARKRLLRLLRSYDDFTVVGEADNGGDGLLLTDDLQPDLIFLDIEMPVLNGFEMLSKLQRQPRVVFTTAYDQYAIKAFEENSVDYLLKPIESERLEKTIQKLRQVHSNMIHLPVHELIQLIHLKPQSKTLTVKVGDKIQLIKLTEIVYIESEEKYVFLHTSDAKKHLTDYTLSALEDKLPQQFVRVHRGAIVNSDYIKEIRKGFNGALVFVMNTAGNARITSSRSNSEMLRLRFEI